MDRLISELPFFNPEHRKLAQTVAQFVSAEIEPRAADVDVRAIVLHRGEDLIDELIETLDLRRRLGER